MHCIDKRPRQRLGKRWLTHVSIFGVVVVTGCATGPAAPPVTVSPSRSAPAPAASADRAPLPVPPAGAAAREPVRLPSPGAVRNVNELHLQAARRIAAANPHLTYDDRAPDVLLAIPVLSVDLNGDGSIHRIEVLRYPRQAKDTTQIAIEAVKRAAPFGDVSRLPRPWRFTETFLFNDDRRFKPRTLDVQ